MIRRSRVILHFGKKQRDRKRLTVAEVWQWGLGEVDRSKRYLRGDVDRT